VPVIGIYHWRMMFIPRTWKQFAVLFALCTPAFAACCVAQLPKETISPTAIEQKLPVTVQLKKSVAFLTTRCLHDYNPELGQLTEERFLQLPLAQQTSVLQQLVQLTSRLASLKAIRTKLDSIELARVDQTSPTVSDPKSVASEAIWRAKLLTKMTAISPSELNSMGEPDVMSLPYDEHMGTGFFVSFVDGRLPQVGGHPDGFTYLVTNRHVVQPGAEIDKPCLILNSTILLNRRPDSTHTSTFAELTTLGRAVNWEYSDDASVDLAVTPITLPAEKYDYMAIPTTEFVTDDELRTKAVVEGDPVLFAGLFIQSFQEVHTLEPIVRSGTLGMVPEAKLKTTMNGKLGNEYLADVHAFGGNSGSPMLVDTYRFQGKLGYDYKLLGAISGEMLENSDLTFNVTTTLTANAAANSDVSMVVPAAEILSILHDKRLQTERDQFIANDPTAPVPAQPVQH
jgi:hypothetical protein